FVASCIDAYIRGNLPVTDGAGGAGAAAGVFDGIDIDWEYPVACGIACGRPEDDANFTALLAEFRRQLDQVRPGLLLTVAVGAGVDKVRVTSPGQYHQYLDYINVMTYDFHGGWDSRTNHHSALFASPADPSTGDTAFYNSDGAIQAFLDRGVPASKLNLGIGVYGRGWTGVPGGDNGLYQSGSAAPRTYAAGIEHLKVTRTRPGTIHTDPVARQLEVRRQHLLELRHAADGGREDAVREGARPGRRVLLGVQRRRRQRQPGRRDRRRPALTRSRHAASGKTTAAVCGRRSFIRIRVQCFRLSSQATGEGSAETQISPPDRARGRDDSCS